MPTLDVSEELLQNELLAVLPKDELAKIVHALERVNLDAGEILWEAGERRQFLYLPTTAIICLLYETEDGSSAEIGIIGRRGVAGIAPLVGEAVELARAVVVRKGAAYRVKGRLIREEFSECGDFQELLLCYAQSLINQLSLTAVCNRLHSVEQQLCRWLLMSYDNQQTTSFKVTHQQVADVLGVRRESISFAASRLQDLGLIKCSRGKIELLDRKGVKAAACSCYSVFNNLHSDLIGKYASRHTSA